MIWSRSAPGIKRHVLMRLGSDAVCIRIHMIKNEATIIHLQRKERSYKITFYVSRCFQRSSNFSAGKGLFAQNKTTI